MAKLHVGDTAPDFNLDSVNAGSVRLSDYKGHRVLLVFGRYFGCPACQLEFDELIEYHRRNPSMRIIYVNQSTPETALKYIKDRAVDFPVISASTKGGKYPFYELYGVGNMSPMTFMRILQKARKARIIGKQHGPYEGRETQTPAQFLIDEEGKILEARYGLFEAIETD